jgi:ElaB/YqjD/DUF883 family membrane-anchored ribosome-binding protein
VGEKVDPESDPSFGWIDSNDLRTLSGVAKKTESLWEDKHLFNLEKDLIRQAKKKRHEHKSLVSRIEQDIQDAAACAGEKKEEIKSRPILEQYKDCASGSVRKQWADKAEKGELTGSGMPAYMQKIIEGKEDEYETEILNYCKLAGLRYKTSKEKIKKEIEQIKSDMFSALWEMERRLDNLSESYKQLDVE